MAPRPLRHMRAITIGDNEFLVRHSRLAELRDPFHLVMTLTWPRFYASIAAFFLCLNLVFAVLYSLQPGCIGNLTPDNLWGDFFFSVETLATVGYGDMHPVTVYAHTIATLEIFTGMMGIALMTGATFARFSRPHARILAADRAVVMNYDGAPTLMLRIANDRHNQIIKASASLYMVIKYQSSEGHAMHRLYDLKLVRDSQPLFILSWTLMHTIDESSALFGLSNDDLAARDASFGLSITGIDETTQQQVSVQYRYGPADIHFNHTYEDLIWEDSAGRRVVEMDSINRIRPLDEPFRQP